MKITKHYDLTLSHKFPTGDIVSVRLGTRLEVDSVLDTADDAEIDKFSAKLSQRAYKLTMRDLKRIEKKDKMTMEVHTGIKSSLRSAENEREAERILEECDDE